MIDEANITKDLPEKFDLAAMPIDFAAFIDAGILEQQDDWYKILKDDELPPHARLKVCVVKVSAEGTFVRFRPAS